MLSASTTNLLQKVRAPIAIPPNSAITPTISPDTPTWSAETTIATPMMTKNAATTMEEQIANAGRYTLRSAPCIPTLTSRLTIEIDRIYVWNIAADCTHNVSLRGRDANEELSPARHLLHP